MVDIDFSRKAPESLQADLSAALTVRREIFSRGEEMEIHGISDVQSRRIISEAYETAQQIIESSEIAEWAKQEKPGHPKTLEQLKKWHRQNGLPECDFATLFDAMVSSKTSVLVKQLTAALMIRDTEGKLVYENDDDRHLVGKALGEDQHFREEQKTLMAEIKRFGEIAGRTPPSLPN